MQPCHCSTHLLILCCSLCRDIGLELYMDACHPPCAALFGDITDDAVLPPTAAAASASGTGGAAAAAGAPAGAAAGAAAGGASQQAEQGVQQQRQQLGSIAELAGAAHVVSCTAVLHCLGRDQVAALLGKVGEPLHVSAGLDKRWRAGSFRRWCCPSTGHLLALDLWRQLSHHCTAALAQLNCTRTLFFPPDCAAASPRRPAAGQHAGRAQPPPLGGRLPSRPQPLAALS